VSILPDLEQQILSKVSKKIQLSGDSFAVYLPSDAVKKMGIDKGTEVDVTLLEVNGEMYIKISKTPERKGD